MDPWPTPLLAHRIRPPPTENPNANRSTTPVSTTFREYISTQWAERAEALPAPRE